MHVRTWGIGFILLMVSVLLAGCGGGGGGSSSGPKDLQVNTSAVTFNATLNGPTPATQDYQISWSRTDVAAVAVGYLPGTTAPTWLSMNLLGNSSPVTLELSVNTSSLALGAYKTTIRIVSVNSQQQVIDIVDIPVTLNVVSPVTASPFAVNFAMNVGDTNLQTQTITLSESGNPVTPTQLNLTTGTAWLQASISGNDIKLTTTSAASMNAGAFTDNLTITTMYGLTTVRVGLIVSNKAVNFVSPYVAYTNQSGDVIIRGHGFLSLTNPAVSFGSDAASTFTVVSDSEIKATHPALAAGNYPVSVSDSATSLTSNATLVVKDPPAYSYAILLSGGAINHQVLYDAERDTIYAVEPVTNSVYRFTFNGTSWAQAGSWSTGSSGSTSCCSISMSPNGKTLYILQDGSITPVNLDTNNAGLAITLDPFLFVAKDVSTANDGSLVISSTLYNYLFRYDPLSDGIAPLSNDPRYINSFNFASADGSKILLPDYATASATFPAAPLTYVDAANEDLVTTNLITSNLFNDYSIDQTGNRFILWHGGSSPQFRVYDGNFNELGTLSIFDGSTAYSQIASVISPDGSRAYTYNDATGTLRVFDLNSPDGKGGFTEIGSGTTLTDFAGANPRMLVTPDGGSIFITGDSHMLVVPAP